jgi:cell division protein FtsQ
MKKFIQLSLFITFLVAVTGLIAYIYILRGQQRLKDIQITIVRESENGFLSVESVTALVNRQGNADISMIKDIDQRQIENLLRQNPYVENVDVLINIHSVLVINIKEKNPVARVFNTSFESFYIDDKGKLFPVSSTYIPKLVVASGNIGASYIQPAANNDTNLRVLRELKELAILLRKNEFLNAQITQIYVADNGEYELVPLLGEHIILFGGIENAGDKIENLEVFYKDALVKLGWDKYKTINIKYKNQVVCLK